MPERCFVAAELPPTTVKMLSRTSDALREAAPGWRGEKWVSPELFHVTIAFLGAIAEADVAKTLADMAVVARCWGPLELRPCAVRAEPRARHPQMLWARFDTGLTDLTGLRDQLLAQACCPVENRRFKAHVTLVRARHPRSFPLAALEAGSSLLSEFGKGVDGLVSVPSLTVYSSTLGAAGPTYRTLAHLRLAESRPTAATD